MTQRNRATGNNRGPRPDLPVAEAAPDFGLTEAQAEERRRLGWDNAPVESPGKSVGQIFFSNIFTYFNLVFFLLAGCVIAVRAWLNLSFLGVVFSNTLIGIVQELRSKAVLDKLRLLDAQRCTVVREGRERTVPAAELVRDDVVIFRGGEQVCADAVVLTGTCQANEALVTGEADEIPKAPGDVLRSGSFLVSGTCRARLTAVGADSFASRLTVEAKRSGRKKESEMMRSLSQLVKWIGVIILPVGVLMCWKEIGWLGRGVQEGVVGTVAALVGMIPEGLYLLTSLALAASVLRLARKNTLVHELSCIETLARVDTLCVDKTGTVTENRMELTEIVPLDPERRDRGEVENLLSKYLGASPDDNDTMAALRAAVPAAPGTALKTLPFTSARKYGGVSFTPGESWLLGAPELLLGTEQPGVTVRAEEYSAQGYRVLLLCRCPAELTEGPLTASVDPAALLLLQNPIRPEAPATFAYFAAQGVTVKVISGDNPRTVSEVARRAGIPGAERWIDARTLDSDAALARAAEENTVFGRVTPEQKRSLVLALKAAGHTVAMTGDGVNDVLALKEADCSVAMAAGSDAASRVSDIVLLHNDFSVMPSVVAEGRRVINNIQRSASLFLVKNLLSFALAVVSLVFSIPYPFTAAQLSLVSMLTIGFPAFVLAMEPNESRIRGKFMRNVLYRAIPAALTDFLLVIGVLIVSRFYPMEPGQQGTVCAILMGFVGLLVVVRLCKPWTRIRVLLVLAVTLGLAGGVLLVPWFFTLVPLTGNALPVLLVFALAAVLLLELSYRTFEEKDKQETPAV